jgi:HEAT repeat protein
MVYSCVGTLYETSLHMLTFRITAEESIMKSTTEQLRSRGYATENDLLSLINKDETELQKLTKDPKPWVRTAAVRALGHTLNTENIPFVVKLLAKETMLYTKLEICDQLISYGIVSLPYLLPYIGKIGKNQHKKPSLVDLRKQSFPLPRDIVARVIIRIGPQALFELEKILTNGDNDQIYEAIDTIGHIAYNYNDLRSEENLFKLLVSKRENEMIQWKVIRAFQAFPSSTVVEFLGEIIKDCADVLIVEEAKRSLFQIRKRIHKQNTAHSIDQ